MVNNLRDSHTIKTLYGTPPYKLRRALGSNNSDFPVKDDVAPKRLEQIE